MNIYELEQKATPGPWVVSGATAVTCPHIGLVLIACDVPNTNTTPLARMQADMELTSHCRNNFMKALEALKGLTEIVLSEYPLHDPRNKQAREAKDLITELEEAKP